MDQSAIVSDSQTKIPNSEKLEILMRPTMLFVLQQHNLTHLQLAMKYALRLAACRVYAMQAFNWLLKSVTQPICLHDLLWWFVGSLSPSTNDLLDMGDEDNRTEKINDHVSLQYYLFMFNNYFEIIIMIEFTCNRT